MAPLFWIENKKNRAAPNPNVFTAVGQAANINKKKSKTVPAFFHHFSSQLIIYLYKFLNYYPKVYKKKKWIFPNKFSHVRLFLSRSFFLLRKGWQHNIHLVKNPLVWPLGWPACNSCCVSWFQLLTFHVSRWMTASPMWQ